MDKLCSKCGGEYPLTQEFFNKHKTTWDGFRNECKKCQKQWAHDYYKTVAERERPKHRQHHKLHKDQFHGYHLKRKFLISRHDYELILEAQDHGCAICGKRKPGDKYQNFAVDHCHNTGKIRALLCSNCNAGLGNFKDDPSLLKKAVEYIEAFV